MPGMKDGDVLGHEFMGVVTEVGGWGWVGGVVGGAGCVCAGWGLINQLE